MITNLNKMHSVPVGIEVLAYHEEGGNFHPVRFDSDGHARMRWNGDYSQYKAHYLGWIDYPEYKAN